MSFKGNLLSVGSNAKTAKSDKAGTEYLTAILYLAPADTVEGINVCPMAELAGCKAACLYKAGRGVMSNVQAGRIRKTILFRDNRDEFMRQLADDIAKFVQYCEKRGKAAAVRLNGTSDIAWENIRHPDTGETLFTMFPQVQFYDYTKIPTRNVKGISNYALTFSYSEASEKYAKLASKAMERGMNVAVVFRTKDLPKTFLGRDVIDGDETDLRFLDPKGVVVGLYAKGPAKKDRTGFVIDVQGAA